MHSDDETCSINFTSLEAGSSANKNELKYNILIKLFTVKYNKKNFLKIKWFLSVLIKFD